MIINIKVINNRMYSNQLSLILSKINQILIHMIAGFSSAAPIWFSRQIRSVDASYVPSDQKHKNNDQ